MSLFSSPLYLVLAVVVVLLLFLLLSHTRREDNSSCVARKLMPSYTAAASIHVLRDSFHSSLSHPDQLSHSPRAVVSADSLFSPLCQKRQAENFALARTTTANKRSREAGATTADKQLHKSIAALSLRATNTTDEAANCAYVVWCVCALIWHHSLPRGYPSSVMAVVVVTQSG